MREKLKFWFVHRTVETAAVITISWGLLVFWLTGEWSPLP